MLSKAPSIYRQYRADINHALRVGAIGSSIKINCESWINENARKRALKFLFSHGSLNLNECIKAWKTGILSNREMAGYLRRLAFPTAEKGLPSTSPLVGLVNESASDNLGDQAISFVLEGLIDQRFSAKRIPLTDPWLKPQIVEIIP